MENLINATEAHKIAEKGKMSNRTIKTICSYIEERAQAGYNDARWWLEYPAFAVEVLQSLGFDATQVDNHLEIKW